MATADPADAQAGARRLTEALALALQGSLMVRHAPSASADAFLGARLGEDRTAQYGSLPRGTDAAVIVARH
jgi:putative acyl-CoA dehydrogenase